MKTYLISLTEEQLLSIKYALFQSSMKDYENGFVYSYEEQRDLYRYLELFSE